MLIERRYSYDVAVQPRLRGSTTHRFTDIFCCLVVAVDGNKFCLDLLAIDSRGRISVNAGHRPSSERPVNVDGASGDDLRAGANRAQHSDVAFGKHDALP